MQDRSGLVKSVAGVALGGVQQVTEATDSRHHVVAGNPGAEIRDGIVFVAVHNSLLLGVDFGCCILDNVMEDRGSGASSAVLARSQRTPSLFCFCQQSDEVVCSERSSQELPTAGCHRLSASVACSSISLPACTYENASTDTLWAS